MPQISEQTLGQHARGKLTAAERLELLFDDGSAAMDSSAPGVVTATGRISGRPAHAFAHDYQISGGSLGAVQADAICRCIAAATDGPLIALIDTAGSRDDDGLAALDGQARIMQALANAAVPRLALVMGPCPGAAAIMAVMADLLFMVRDSAHLFITGPEVIRTVTREEITLDALSGAQVHTERTGLAHGAFRDDVAAISALRGVAAFLPLKLGMPAPVRAPLDAKGRPAPALDSLRPADGRAPYDMVEAVTAIADDADVVWLGPRIAPNLLTGLIRLNGRSTGVIASQPKAMSGVLDMLAATKAARFVTLCGRLGLPLLVMADAPGFLPLAAQEHARLAGALADLARARLAAQIPSVVVVTRRANGGAHGVLASRPRNGTVLAWEGATFSLGLRDETAAEAVAAGLADEMIAPRDTRARVIAAFAGSRAITP